LEDILNLKQFLASLIKWQSDGFDAHQSVSDGRLN
jgi:hypothetical protein